MFLEAQFGGSNLLVDYGIGIENDILETNYLVLVKNRAIKLECP